MSKDTKPFGEWASGCTDHLDLDGLIRSYVSEALKIQEKYLDKFTTKQMREAIGGDKPLPRREIVNAASEVTYLGDAVDYYWKQGNTEAAAYFAVKMGRAYERMTFWQQKADSMLAGAAAERGAAEDKKAKAVAEYHRLLSSGQMKRTEA